MLVLNLGFPSVFYALIYQVASKDVTQNHLYAKSRSYTCKN